MEVIEFSNGARVKLDNLEKASDCALRAIEKELPEEVLSYEVYQYVIGKCTDRLNQKKIVL